jgi:hypothetical protein
MRKTKSRPLICSVIAIFLGAVFLSAIPLSYGEPAETEYPNTVHAVIEEEQELALLHGEIAFHISLSENENHPFIINYSMPPTYENQTPVFFEIRNDSTAEILSYSIVNDTNPPNKIITFTLKSMNTGETTILHFDFWVLIENNEYTTVPQSVPIPEENELPADTLPWLESTKAVQSSGIRIRWKASQLRDTNENLFSTAQQIVQYTSSHKTRSILWLLANRFSPNSDSGWAKYLDATSSLFFGGSCTGRANLGTALFRANGIPAKVLHVMPTWYTSWYDMHYISEYYHQGYGWVLAETVLGNTPYQPKNNIILRVNYPEDENSAGNRYDYYGGCEQWFWVQSKNIHVYWNHSGSGTRSWLENNITIDQGTAHFLFNFTTTVYNLYTRYLGTNLTGLNQDHFNNATVYQKDAIQYFKQSDIGGYTTAIYFAYLEYEKIG